MSEAVVPGSTEIFATLAVVVGRTGDPVLVDHHRVVRPVLVLYPLGTNVQPPLGSEPRYYDSLLRTCALKDDTSIISCYRKETRALHIINLPVDGCWVALSVLSWKASTISENVP